MLCRLPSCEGSCNNGLSRHSHIPVSLPVLQSPLVDLLLFKGDEGGKKRGREEEIPFWFPQVLLRAVSHNLTLSMWLRIGGYTIDSLYVVSKATASLYESLLFGLFEGVLR